MASAPRPARPKADGTGGCGNGGADLEGRVRAVIDAVLPTVDGGRFPVKRIAGEAVAVEAHCFTDGHDRLRVVLRWQAAGAARRLRSRHEAAGPTMSGAPNLRRRDPAATATP